MYLYWPNLLISSQIRVAAFCSVIMYLLPWKQHISFHPISVRMRMWMRKGVKVWQFQWLKLTSQGDLILNSQLGRSKWVVTPWAYTRLTFCLSSPAYCSGASGLTLLGNARVILFPRPFRGVTILKRAHNLVNSPVIQSYRFPLFTCSEGRPCEGCSEKWHVRRRAPTRN